MLTVIFDFNKVGILILWVFVMTYIYFYQIDTTFNLTVKMGHSVPDIRIKGLALKCNMVYYLGLCNKKNIIGFQEFI